MAALQGLAGLSSAERYDSIQLKTFTRWWNMYLKERQLKLEDLCEDIVVKFQKPLCAQHCSTVLQAVRLCLFPF